MANHSGKSWQRSCQSGYRLKAAPRPSSSIFQVEPGPSSSPPISPAITSCLSGCLDGFGNFIDHRDEDLTRICVVISSSSLFSLYCCDLGCGLRYTSQRIGQDGELVKENLYRPG